MSALIVLYCAFFLDSRYKDLEDESVDTRGKNRERVSYITNCNLKLLVHIKPDIIFFFLTSTILINWENSEINKIHLSMYRNLVIFETNCNKNN